MNDRMFVFGDIPGCSKALAALLDAIRPTQKDTLIFLGALDGGGSDLQFWLKFGGAEVLASYGCRDAREIGSRHDLRALVPPLHIDFIKNCSDFYESPQHIFVHAYYDPVLPLARQKQSVLRWGTLPTVPEPHCSGKIAIFGHTAQENGEILDQGCLKCIDTFCHGGGWLTALEVKTGQIWQANMAGELRD
jgi:serine/threonine protein phosphatase 1